MLKSSLVVSISALILRSTKAIWALLFVCTIAIAAVVHLLAHDHVASGKAAGDLATLDLVGSTVYVIGVAVFG